MIVRKTAKTTLSLLFILFVIEYLRSNNLSMISSNMPGSLRHIPSTLVRLAPFRYMGDYYPILFYVVAGLIVFVCIIDVILKSKVGFGLLSSFNIPIIFAVVILILLGVAKLYLFRLWGLLFLLMLAGLYWTYKKFLNHIGTNGKSIYKNPIDDFMVSLVKFLIRLVGGVVMISFIFYLISYWKAIFC